MSGSFVSDTVLNLSRKVLTDTEMKVLKKGLDFAPIQRKLNEPELRRDFRDFCRRLRFKWYFRDEPTPFFSEQPSFSPKSSCSPLAGQTTLTLKYSLVKLIMSCFRFLIKALPIPSLPRRRDKPLDLIDDRSIVTEKADKGPFAVVWDRDDYFSEAEKQLCDKAIYKGVSFNEEILFRKLHFLPKIYKKLFNLPGRPVISNCGTPTGKASEFSDHHLKPVMQSSWSYIKESGEFLRKIKQIGNLPENSILGTADDVGLYPSVPYELGLKVLEEALEKRESKQISTDNLIKLAKFVLQNNYFEFNGEV